MYILTTRLTELAHEPPLSLAKSDTIPETLAPLMSSDPMLRYIAGAMTLMTFAAALLAWYKASKPKSDELAAAPKLEGDSVTAIYFTGPLKAIFDLLTEIKALLLLLRLQVKDDTAVLVSDAKGKIIDDMGDRIGQGEARLTDNVNSVHERIDLVNNNLIRIDTRLDVKGRR